MDSSGWPVACVCVEHCGEALPRGHPGTVGTQDPAVAQPGLAWRGAVEAPVQHQPALLKASQGPGSHTWPPSREPSPHGWLSPSSSNASSAQHPPTRGRSHRAEGSREARRVVQTQPVSPEGPCPSAGCRLAWPPPPEPGDPGVCADGKRFFRGKGKDSAGCTLVERLLYATRSHMLTVSLKAPCGQGSTRWQGHSYPGSEQSGPLCVGELAWGCC